MKLLFLDFDGVINPLLGSGKFSKVACGHVATMLIKEPMLRIVISSSWRRNGLEICREILKDNGIDPTKVIGMTEKEGGWLPEGRSKQIATYLKNCDKEVSQYVILDDYPMNCDNFVKCNGYIGFTESDMKEALEILSHETR